MLLSDRQNAPGFDVALSSERLRRTKTARVLVPSDSPPHNGWPLCCLLHSFGGNRLSWIHSIGSSLGRFPWARCVLVIPESGRRWFMNDVAGYLYEDYLVSELLPTLDSALPIRSDPMGRSVGGFSMGGAAAVALALRHPDCFGVAFSYSGAFYANRRLGDPYRDFRSGPCMMPTEAEHERVWGPPGSATRSSYDPDHLVALSLERGFVPQLAITVGVDDYARVVEVNRS